jgi:hypothetical protein
MRNLFIILITLFINQSFADIRHTKTNIGKTQTGTTERIAVSAMVLAYPGDDDDEVTIHVGYTLTCPGGVGRYLSSSERR